MEVAVALGTDPVTTYAGSMPLPKHIDELAVAGVLRERPRRARALQDGRPRGAGQRRDRDRGLRRARRAAARGPVRRPHGLLHAARAVPGAARHGDHAPPRPDLPVDRRRRAAGRGRLARQGDGAHLPARRADDAAGGRGLRPAVRRRLPQLLHRLDPQALPGPRPKGHARDLGHGPALADEGGRRGRRVGRRARLRAGRVAARRERRPGPRRAPLDGPARPARPLARTSQRSAARSASTRRTWPEEGYPRTWPEVARMSRRRPRGASTRAGTELGIGSAAMRAGAAPAPGRGRRGWLSRRGS